VLFLFQDPLGDAHGLAYLYPQAALYREAGEGYADLTALAGEVREGELVLKLRLARYPNPLGGPLGFSLATALVYLDLAPGGEEALLPGLRTPPGQGWEDALALMEEVFRMDFQHPGYLPGYVLARMGQLLDLAGERERALRAYRGVLALSWAPEEARAVALAGLKTPFRL